MKAFFHGMVMHFEFDCNCIHDLRPVHRLFLQHKQTSFFYLPIFMGDLPYPPCDFGYPGFGTGVYPLLGVSQ